MCGKSMTWACCVVLFGGGLAGAQDRVALKELTCIVLSPRAGAPESEAAKLLAQELAAVYDITLPTRAGATPETPGIYLGREASLASGLITAADLEAVKHDGYVIRSRGSLIAVAGFGPQGALFGAHALLRRMGIRFYPGQSLGNVKVVRPLPDATLPPLSLSSKPFFEYRGILPHHDRGYFGATMKDGGVGDVTFALNLPEFKDRGWLGADHTGPYLVPIGLYHKEHPEYFAVGLDGRRLPYATPSVRAALCLSNPDVHRIAARRAMEWIGLQPERRFFYITNGDAQACRCPECTAKRTAPGSNTDLYLSWVNNVAREMKKTHPEKIAIVLAYINSVPPPAREAPESNVVVLYCPWYWNARATSAVTWASPLNVQCMKEFMAWALKFPGRVGVYDYPGDWTHGLAGRIKFLAKNDAKWFYGCGGGGSLYQWVNSRLLWDPFLDTSRLVDEFAEAYYGLAPGTMREYLKLHERETERRHVYSSRTPHTPAFLDRTRELMGEAERLAAQADDAAQCRILQGVQEGLALVIGSCAKRADADEARLLSDIQSYVKVTRRLSSIGERLKNRYFARQRRDSAVSTLVDLNLAEALPENTKVDDEMLHSLASGMAERVRAHVRSLKPTDSPAPCTVTTTFDGPAEAERWLSDGSEAALLTTPISVQETGRVLGPIGGVRVTAALSRLPVATSVDRKVHAGRFYFERGFDPPLDAGAGHFLCIHLRASRDVPATVYLGDRIRADIRLHAGEQIVRVDLRNYHDPKKWEYAEWDRKVHRIAMDLWPQDNLPPYGPAQDTELVFYSVTFTNQSPERKSLPATDKAAWLTQFRPNVPFPELPLPGTAEHQPRQKYRHPHGDRGTRFGPGFRSYTEHRTLTPIVAILTGDTPAELQCARQLQDRMKALGGVRLPINPPGMTASPSTGNAFILGAGAALASGQVSAAESARAGPRGFVIDAWDGRIVIAGKDAAATSRGVSRYLEDHGVRFLPAGKVAVEPDPGGLLHELYLVDWPYFDTELPSGVAGPPGTASPSEVEALAEAIKDCARSGKRELPEDLMRRANADAITRHVAARLLWDPFLDAAALIRGIGQ